MISHVAPRALVAMLALGLLVAAARHVTPQRATTPELGGPDRYLTALSTDKPIYRPGETLYSRGVVLHASKRTPMAAGLGAQVTVIGPKGEQVANGWTATQDGVWTFVWPVPAESAGGEYTLKVTYPGNVQPPAERKFDVRVYRAPRLESQIVFLRDGYGPGDKVTATLEVKRAEGGVPAGAKVTATAQVDGRDAAQVVSQVDDKGRCTVSFALPKEIARGEGALAFAIEDGGVVETAAKTLPILLRTLDLSLYPEGGDLVAGLPSRVYFEARTPAHKPADLSGVVVEKGSGREVAHFRSEHEGRGRFEFTPERGARYELRVTEPAGIATAFALPEAKASGASLRGTKDVFPRGKTVELNVGLSGLSRAWVTLARREEAVATASVSGSGPVVLDAGNADGVLVATVWDDDGRPLAERLVYREPEKKLSVDVRADKKSYAPGEEVKLTVRTTREGEPVSAVVGLTVTDSAVLELIERREQAPRLPVMVMLEPEVRELADAQVYLDPENPKSKLALDLLLGTQGWRRFAFSHVSPFLAEHGDAARRALAYAEPPPPPMPEEEMDIPMPAQAAGVPGMAMGGAQRPMAMPMPKSAPRGMPAMPQMAPAAPPMAQHVPKQVAMAPLASMNGPVRRGEAKKEMADKAMRGMPMMDRMEAPMRARRAARIVMPPSYIREYAHALLPNREPGDRKDFSETLYWNAGTRTDAGTGEATVRFFLNDSVTSFKAFADAFDGQGSLGAGTATVRSVQPFYVEAKLPLEVTSGDVIQLPLALVNGTPGVLGNAVVNAQANGDFRFPRLASMSLQPEQRARRLMELRMGDTARTLDLTFAASAGGYADTVTRKLVVKPSGFPVRLAFGGRVGPQSPASHRFTVPEKVVPGSLTARAVVFPSPLANLTESLAALLQEPNGCFEQTSSTTYPMTMAQQYFLSHTGVEPSLVESAKEKLDRGYKRLTGFECSEHGYEWFGQNPGHEALTAYGLMQFTDMKQVREVDAAMLDRTRAWLLQQRDGQGGFNRKRRALHVWVEDKDTSNAYILWSLLEAGERNVQPEVASLKEASARSQNSYVWALAANVMALSGNKADAATLMGRLAEKQDPNGVVGGATQSIVGSGGEALEIETTSLATLAWLRNPAFAGNVERAMKYLADSCKGGRYGSTQSTVLALKAIVAYDAAHAKPKAAGLVRVYVDGQPVGEPVRFDGETKGALALPDLSSKLRPGERQVELRMEGGAEMPYSLVIDYNTLTPVSSKQSPVGLSVELEKSRLTEGEPVQARAVVTNKSGAHLPTVVAIIGLPGGLEPRHDQLKELVKKGTIDSYEVRGREVVVYWRGLEANGRRDVPLSLLAAVPGTYTGPASRAYLYYTDEHKTWQDGVRVEIQPRG